MKRILLVSPFPPYIGGVSISVQRLSDYLAHSGYHVVRFNTQIKDKKFNFKILKFLKYLFLPVNLLLQPRFDVIHFHVSHVIPKLYVALWRPLFPKTKFVITIHGQILTLFRRTAGKFALSRFDKIILVAKGDTERMPEELRHKTVEIPAFIPPFIPETMSDGLPSGLKNFLNRDSFKILLNGSVIVNEKYNDLYGFRDALTLVEKLKDRKMNVDLIMIVMGDGHNNTAREYIGNLKRYAGEKKFSDSVYWVEGVTMELWPLLKKVNVLLRPTKSDGDALSVRESLFLNVPVISSDVVPRPDGTLVYKLESPEDLLSKVLSVINNYDDQKLKVSLSGANINFADKIIEQYEY